MGVPNTGTLKSGAAAPFIVAITLFLLMVTSPFTGIRGPSSNAYFAAGAALILIGLMIGMLSLIMLKKTQIWLRILVGLAYLPTLLMSVLLIGA
jgi:hypothetical protein